MYTLALLAWARREGDGAEDPGTFLPLFPLRAREAGMFRSGWVRRQFFTFVLGLVG